MSFPRERPRRLRYRPSLRAMVAETHVRPEHLVLPLFATYGKGVRREVPSMPGVFQLSVDEIVKAAQEASNAGVTAVLLFGIPEHKDSVGSSAWDANGPVARSVAEIKAALPTMNVMTDVCLCEYTDHGHCGRTETRKDGTIDVANDPTLELLAQEAVCHARAGADVIAPSDMMDGRVGFIRDALDREGFGHVVLMSYSAKYASALYGPFRDAAESTPRSGPQDRKTYQMNPANRREAVREARLDVEEGADIIMVKPALPYLDIIRDIRESVDVPVAAYSVSGEYSMLKTAALSNRLDERACMLELLTCIRRAGADLIITYYAMEAAKVLS